MKCLINDVLLTYSATSILTCEYVGKMGVVIKMVLNGLHVFEVYQL